MIYWFHYIPICWDWSDRLWSSSMRSMSVDEGLLREFKVRIIDYKHRETLIVRWRKPEYLYQGQKVLIILSSQWMITTIRSENEPVYRIGRRTMKWFRDRMKVLWTRALLSSLVLPYHFCKNKSAAFNCLLVFVISLMLA